MWCVLLGDWAGASFATSGCPGSCGQTVQDPSNFVVSACNCFSPVNLMRPASERVMDHQLSSCLPEDVGDRCLTIQRDSCRRVIGNQHSHIDQFPTYGMDNFFMTFLFGISGMIPVLIWAPGQKDWVHFNETGLLEVDVAI
jgi:hypothetical protein